MNTGIAITLSIIIILVLVYFFWFRPKKPVPGPPLPKPVPGPQPPPPPLSNDFYYNPRYSGTNKAAGTPMLNSYSKMVADSAYGVYGFSLDDAVGLKRCGSWTLNTIIGPRCNTGKDGKCKLPVPGVVPPVSSQFTLTDVTDKHQFADDDPNWSSVTNKGAYFTKSQVMKYLKVLQITGQSRVDSTGTIDTDFTEFPQNQYFTDTLKGDQMNVKNNSHMNFAFNVINQSGGSKSLIKNGMPIWASIEIGSPPVVAVVKKINANEGFQFLFDFGSDVLTDTLILQPDNPIRNKFLSGYLSSSDYATDPDSTWCAAECNKTYTKLQQFGCVDIENKYPTILPDGTPGMGISTDDLYKLYPNVCNKTDNPIGADKMPPRGLGAQTCDLTLLPRDREFYDFGLSDGSVYKFADVTCGFGKGNCPTVNPKVKSASAYPCPTGSYTENDNVIGQWDSSVTQCSKGDNKSMCNVNLNPICQTTVGRVTPMCCDDTRNDTIHACGNKTVNGTSYESHHYAWQVGGGRISISYVDPSNLESEIPDNVYNEMVLTPLCASDRCDSYPRTNDWRAQKYITGAKIASSIKDNYASLIEFTLDMYTNINDPVKIIPVINYDISGVNNLSSLPLYSKAVGVNKSVGACKTDDCCFTFVGNIGEDIIKNCPTDIYYTTDKSGKTRDNWGKCPSPIDYCIKPDTDVGASGKAPSSHPLCNLWNDFQPELIKPYIEPNSKKNNPTTPIWGCDPNYINSEKCRSMHLGTFPNYSQLLENKGTSSQTPFNPPPSYLPWGFQCDIPGCEVTKGAKPYQKGISMDCTSEDKLCCGNKTITSNYCWGNGSIRYQGN